MLDEDPIIVVRDLLSQSWESANTPLANDPRIHTGWYDYGSSDPQVTVTNSEEFTAEGGDTGYTAGTGDGGVAQVRVGTILVNCWAGSRDDLEGAGTDGSDVNPKDAAYQMANEVHRIMSNNADGTTDDSGNRQLNSLSADDARRLVETDETPTVFRHEVTVRYTYVDRT